MSNMRHKSDKETGLSAPVMDRRQFLKWLGLAGAVAVVGAGAGLRGAVNALSATVSDEQTTSATVGTEVVQVPTAVATEVVQSSTAVASAVQSSAATTQSTTASCTVRCRNACSYPGHCKRYIDSNGNNRCDYGECM